MDESELLVPANRAGPFRPKSSSLFLLTQAGHNSNINNSSINKISSTSYWCIWIFSAFDFGKQAKYFVYLVENPWSDLDARYGVYAIINFVSESAGGHDLWVLGGVTHQNCALNHLKKRTSHGSSIYHHLHSCNFSFLIIQPLRPK